MGNIVNTNKDPLFANDIYTKNTENVNKVIPIFSKQKQKKNKLTPQLHPTKGPSYLPDILFLTPHQETLDISIIPHTINTKNTSNNVYYNTPCTHTISSNSILDFLINPNNI